MQANTGEEQGPQDSIGPSDQGRWPSAADQALDETFSKRDDGNANAKASFYKPDPGSNFWSLSNSP